MVVTEELIHEYAEGAILLDGLEEAIIGIVEEFGAGPRILYSTKKIVSILQESGMMDEGGGVRVLLL